MPVQEIVENGYELSINRYKEIEYEEVHYEKPNVILNDIKKLEEEIVEGIKALEEMIG